jgi:fatty-acyl-CoA synthase
MTSTAEPAAERETERPGSGSEMDINAAAAVHRNARYRLDSIVIRYAGVDLTYTQLDGRAARLASVLADGGLAEGDRVAYVDLNSPSFLPERDAGRVPARRSSSRSTSGWPGRNSTMS